MVLSLRERAYSSENRFVVALDGPSASGKGTIGRLLSQRFNLKYFQSSIVYRGLALMCIDQEVNLNDITKIILLSTSPSIIEYAQNKDLNNENIADVASRIAIIPEVRKNLGIHLIKLIEKTHRIIMEGRDIATVIAPDADLKIFIIADINTRAERRYKELHAQGKNCILPDILNQLKARDLRDQEREAAPLRSSPDSLVIDTSHITPMQVVEKIQEFIDISR